MHKQSPIHIHMADTIDGHAYLSLHWQPFDGHIIDTGFLIRVCGEGGYLTFKDQRYDFVDFHFHSPGEHYIDGKTYPMEMHFVHYNTDLDRHVVLAIFIDESLAPHDEFQKVINHLPHKDTENCFFVNPLAFLPEDTQNLYYEGSLTVPPCLETVSWQIFPRPIRAQKKQMKAIITLRDNNIRPTQDLNGRVIHKLKPLQIK